MQDSIIAGLKQMLQGIPGVLDVIDLTGADKPIVSLDTTGEGPAVIRRKGTERTFMPVSSLSAETARLSRDLISLKKNFYEGLEEKKKLSAEVTEQGKIISTESSIIKHRLGQKFPEQAKLGELSLKLENGEGRRILLQADGFPVDGVEVDQEFGLPILDRIRTCREAESAQEVAEEGLRKLIERDASELRTLEALTTALRKQLEKDHSDVCEFIDAVAEKDGEIGVRMEREIDEVLEELPNDFKRRIILKHLAEVQILPPEVIKQFDLEATIEAIDHLLPPKE
jgi:hypothetical protein